MVADNADPVGAAPREATHLGDRWQRGLAWAALACAVPLAVLALMGCLVVLRGGVWGAESGDLGEDIALAPVVFGAGGVAVAGAATWVAGGRRGPRAADRGRTAALLAFAIAALGLGLYGVGSEADWPAGLAWWASVGGLFASATGVWLRERERGAPRWAALGRVAALLVAGAVGCVVVVALVLVIVVVVVNLFFV